MYLAVTSPCTSHEDRTTPRSHACPAQAPPASHNLQARTAAKRHERNLQLSSDKASLQTSFVALDREIQMTSRRVNALEYVVIPRIEETVQWIKGEMDDSNKCDEGVCLGLNCKSLQDYINYVQKLRTESEKRAREERRRNK